MTVEKPPIVRPPQKEQPSGKTGPTLARRSSGWWLIVVLFLLLCGGMTGLIVMAYCVVPASVEPLTHKRLAQSKSYNVSSSCSTQAVESTRGYSRLPCGTLLIRTASNHPLLTETSRLLTQQLSELKPITGVEYCAAESADPPGGAAPAATVVLDAVELDETPANEVARSGSLVLHTTLRMTLANNLFDCRAGYHDGLDPPVVTYQMTAELKHDSTTTGIRDLSKRYDSAADSITQQVVSVLSEKLNALYERYRPLPTMTPLLYPAYRSPPRIPLPADEHLVMLRSYHGFMYANETLWQFTSRRETETVLNDLANAFDQLDWTQESLSTAANQIPHLRVKARRSRSHRVPSNIHSIPSPHDLNAIVIRTEDKRTARASVLCPLSGSHEPRRHQRLFPANVGG